MIHYFQLTPDILLEYIYEGDPKLDEDKIKGNSKDIYDDSPTMLLKSEAFSSKYLFFKNDSEGLDSFSNLVLPLNNTQTQFVIAKSDYNNFFSRTNVSNRFLTKSGSGYLYVDTNYDADIQNAGKSCDVRYDKCIVHFTSRNFFGNYDSLIFQAYAYMNDKSKLYFASFLFKKTSNLEMTPEHLLYNEKLYTTQIEFDIPSVYAILSTDESIRNDVFNGVLSNKGVNLLQNTPIGIDLYGVSGSTKGTDNYVRLKTNKINSISIPYTYNRFDEIHIDIYEALDGDYFYIDPKIGRGYSSFVDYIESMGEDIRAYMIMHELSLIESFIGDNGEPISETTHKEFHIIDINEDDEDDEIHRRFDAKIKYRPICMKSGDAYKATIIDTIKIINTVDSSSYEVKGSLEINPKKYGKKIMKLDFNNEVRPIVNVYNKNTSSNRNGISGIPGYGSVSGTKTIGSLNGSFSFSVSGGISGEYSGTLSELGNFVGIISGVFSESGSLTGNISGTLSDLGGFISGTFSNQEFGKISGTISGYITGLGYVTGTITGTYTNDGFGEIWGTITSSSSNSSISSANDSTSNSTSEGLVVVNKGGGFYVENMTQNITSFIESTNVGVCIVELSPDDIN